jgi:hypothetical protein
MQTMMKYFIELEYVENAHITELDAPLVGVI